jgi:hypothetical protein
MAKHDNDQIFNDSDLNYNGTSDLSNSESVHEEIGLANPNFEEKNEVESKASDVETSSTDTTNSSETSDTKEEKELVKQEENNTSNETNETNEDDEVEVSINQEGDLVDSNGKILAKKDEFTYDEETGEVSLEKDEAVNEMNSITANLQETHGIELVDESGNPLTFDSTPQGVIELASAVGNKLNEKYMEELWEEVPQLKSYFEHIVAGGSDAEFFTSETNYKQINIPEDTETNAEANKRLRRDIIKQKFILSHDTSNYTQEDFNKLYNDAEEWAEFTFSKGVEVDKATEDLNWLHRYEDNLNAERDRRNQEIIEERKQSNIQYWQEVKGIVDTGELQGINIPKSERDSFYKYISVPVTKEGYSQSQVDRMQGGHKSNLVLEYMRFKKLDLDRLIDSKAKTEQVKRLKMMASGSKQSLSNKGTSLKIKKKSVNLDNISLQNLSRVKK